MKIVKRIEDDIVLYAGDDLVLDDTGVRGNGWRSSVVTAKTAVLQEVDDLPDDFIGNGWAYIDGVWISNTTGDAYIARKNTERNAEAAAVLKSQALVALASSDVVAIRCVKAGVQFPDEWREYVAQLRTIVGGVSDPLPDPPAYPEGT